MATRASARARADDEWLTTAQVAELTGYNARTLANMRYPSATTEGPPWHTTPGGAPRYKRSEVVKWIARQYTKVKAAKKVTKKATAKATAKKAT